MLLSCKTLDEKASKGTKKLTYIMVYCTQYTDYTFGIIKSSPFWSNPILVSIKTKHWQACERSKQRH